MQNQNLPSEASLGPLPQGWEHITPQSGLAYFANHDTKIITYYDPRKPNPHPGGFKTIPLSGAPLPNGWEIVGREDGQVSFLNHNLHTATTNDPRISEAGLAESNGDGGKSH
jgi:hypothetical protein